MAEANENEESEKKEQGAEEEEDNKIPDYYLAEFEEAFSILDDEGTKMLPTMKLWILLRMLGTPGDLQDHIDLLSNYDPDRTGFVDYNSCLEIMAEKWKNLEPYDELKEAFLKFDDQATGYIKEKDLRTIMSTLGNPLNKQELTKFMKAVMVNAKGFMIWDDYLDILNPNR